MEGTAAILWQLLAETDALLAEAQAELRRLEDYVRTLEAERYGVELALARHRGERPIAASGSGLDALTSSDGARGVEGSSWHELSRADAVLEVLLAEDRPMTRAELVERLAETGRVGDHADAVSAALAYLRRTGRARKLGAGLWEPVPEEAAVT